MAKVGLSKPYFALYTASGTPITVSYSGATVLGKYTEMNIEVEASDDNILYADNAPAESDKAFTGGTFTMSTSDLSLTNVQTLFGITPDSDGWTVFDDNMTNPYFGMGGIIKKIVNGTTTWVAFILDKVQFAIPSIAAITQGESIEWQTQELSATILRSDEGDHPWFRMQEYTTEALAEAAITTFLA